MRLGLATSPPKSWPGKLYLGAVAISWTAFVFTGVKGLLFWMPSELAVSFAGTAALLGFFLLSYLEESAYVRHTQIKSLKIRKELEQLIRYATIPSDSTIKSFEGKANLADTAAEREAFKELSRLAAGLAERDKKLWEYARQEMVREAAAQTEAKLASEKVEKTLAQRQAIRKKLIESASQLQTFKTLEDIPLEVEALLDLRVVQACWSKLDEFGIQLNNAGPGSALSSLIKTVSGVHVLGAYSFTTELVGNERDGHFEVHAWQQGEKCNLLSAIRFKSSPEGVIAAFYFSVVLKTRLCWGHGFYGRDEEPVFTLEHAVGILEKNRIEPNSKGLEQLSVPPGLRITRSSEGSTMVSCLVFLPSKGFHNQSVVLDNGQAAPRESQPLFEWMQAIYY